MMTTLSLVRLLQLSSPALPIGAYSYSQGLEWAIEAGAVHDEASAQRWIGDLLEWNLGRFEAPYLANMIGAWRSDDTAQLHSLNDDYLASRETAELRAETLQMGYSLRRLLDELPTFCAATLATLRKVGAPSFPLAWSAAASGWQVAVEEALAAYLWAWAENQVMAAIKTVPLGQTAGQRVLMELGARVPDIARRALDFDDEHLSNLAPGFAIACSRHETQYSRLFRS